MEPDLVLIPAGAFVMGDARGRDDERPEHRVWVDAFEIGRYAVSNEEYARFLDETGHHEPGAWRDPRLNRPRQPVAAVSWFDCVDYCGWLSEKTGKLYRLPTEAEREKAARGGREGARYPWGDEEPAAVGRFAIGKLAVSETVDVDDDPLVNGFGLYHMGDNLHEWCLDWYDPGYYASSPERNPRGPALGDARASRGGSWRHHVKTCRCAARSSIPPDRRFTDYGFRVVRAGGP